MEVVPELLEFSADGDYVYASGDGVLVQYFLDAAQGQLVQMKSYVSDTGAQQPLRCIALPGEDLVASL